MKTMTCQQLGGPCELAHRAETADEVIKAQDRHLREMVASGDQTHERALKEMKGRWKHPISGMGWYNKAKRDFAGPCRGLSTSACGSRGTHARELDARRVPPR
jgi:hypothetical protein